MNHSGAALRIAHRIFYALVLAGVIWGWYSIYTAYLQHYKELNPELVWVSPWVHTEYVPLKGVLLWDEAIIITPRGGQVNYPHSPGPVKVAKGSTVATVGGAAIRAPAQGLFLAALDGQERKWRYPVLWSENTIPSAPKVKWFGGGQMVGSGNAVGKIVLQPQDIRFLGYIDITGTVEKDLNQRRLKVRHDDNDTASYVPVRVFERYGNRAKVYLSLPWLTPYIVKSRGIEMSVEVGKVEGVVVPESAVVDRDGRRGVFSVRGARAIFVEIDGKPIGDDRFLVLKGLKIGDAVIVQGSDAREGRVQLW